MFFVLRFHSQFVYIFIFSCSCYIVCYFLLYLCAISCVRGFRFLAFVFYTCFVRDLGIIRFWSIHTLPLALSLSLLLCNIKRLLSAWFVISLVPTCVYRRHQSNVLYRCELLGKLITNTWRRQLRPPTAFATRYSLHWMYIIAIVGDVSSSPLLAFSASIIAISWSMGVMHQRSLL